MLEESIIEFQEPVKVQERTGRTKIKGKFRDTFAPVVNMTASAIPAGENDFVIEPGGERIKAEKKFYFVGKVQLKDGTLVTSDEGIIYEIRGYNDRSFHGNYTVFMGNRRR